METCVYTHGTCFGKKGKRFCQLTATDGVRRSKQIGLNVVYGRPICGWDCMKAIEEVKPLGPRRDAVVWSCTHPSIINMTGCQAADCNDKICKPWLSPLQRVAIILDSIE